MFRWFLGVVPRLLGICAHDVRVLRAKQPWALPQMEFTSDGRAERIAEPWPNQPRYFAP